MMDSNEVALIISAVAASIASIIYSFKHVRKSECCGNSCVQQVDGIPETPKMKRDSIELAIPPKRERDVNTPDPTQPSIWDWVIRPKKDQVSTEV